MGLRRSLVLWAKVLWFRTGEARRSLIVFHSSAPVTLPKELKRREDEVVNLLSSVARAGSHATAIKTGHYSLAKERMRVAPILAVVVVVAGAAAAYAYWLQAKGIPCATGACTC